jgi:hypothetical protein
MPVMDAQDLPYVSLQAIVDDSISVPILQVMCSKKLTAWRRIKHLADLPRSH